MTRHEQTQARIAQIAAVRRGKLSGAKRHDGRPAWQDAPERLRASDLGLKPRTEEEAGPKPEPAYPGILQRIFGRVM